MKYIILILFILLMGCKNNTIKYKTLNEQQNIIETCLPYINDTVSIK